MPFGMGLNKNRHGTYEARKKVPQHLEVAVARVLDNGKPKQVWLSALSPRKILLKQSAALRQSRSSSTEYSNAHKNC